MNEIRYSSNAIVHYLLIYILVSISGGMLPDFIGGDRSLLILAGISIFYIIAKRKLTIDKSYFAWIVVLFCLSILSMLYSSISFGTIFNIIIQLIYIYIVVDYDKTQVINRLLKYGCIICTISIGIYCCIRLFGFETFSPIYTKLYTKAVADTYTIGNGYGGLLFYRFIPVHSHQNCGPFSEPGEYAVFLNVLLYFAINYYPQENEKVKSRYIICFLVGILTCQSTSGYIMLALIVLISIFTKNHNIFKNKKIIGLIIIGVLFLGNYLRELYYVVISNKIIVNGVLDFSNGSSSARYVSINDVLGYINSNPSSIFGIGFDAIQNNQIDTCAGLLILLLTLGIGSFGVLYGHIIISSYRFRISTAEFFMELVIIVTTGLSQPAIIFSVVVLMSVMKMLGCCNTDELEWT